MRTKTIMRIKTSPLFASLAFVFVMLCVLLVSPVRAFEGPTVADEQEPLLLAVLRSDAAAAEKALACKNLAIYGSGRAVPELAKLLPDPQLSS